MLAAVKCVNIIFLKNVIFWYGSFKNQQFRGTYHLHLQGDENNQQTKNMLAVSSDCSTLQRINHSMRKEAVECDIFHDGRERMLLQRRFCCHVFPWQANTWNYFRSWTTFLISVKCFCAPRMWLWSMLSSLPLWSMLFQSVVNFEEWCLLGCYDVWLL
jgi:hypothetical protein